MATPLYRRTPKITGVRCIRETSLVGTNSPFAALHESGSYRGYIGRAFGVRPRERTGSGCGFARLPGILLFERCGAPISQATSMA
jgi:hypothetical protein